MVILPVRADEFGLFARKKPTVPGPLPVAPEVMVIQLALLAADQEQAGCVVTAAVPFRPPEADFILPKVTPYVQDVPACVTTNFSPAMVMFPVRAADVFAAT